MALFQRPSPETVRQHVLLSRYAPDLKLTALVPGVDNIRHDVHLSPRLLAVTAQHVFQLLLKHSNAKALVESTGSAPKPTDRNEFKRLVQELLLGALSQARAQRNPDLDLLASAAFFKYLGWEIQRQYSVIFQQGKNKLKQYEGPKHEHNTRALQLKQLFSDFQTQKKITLRLVADELQRAVNEVQADAVRKTRESYFGPEAGAWSVYLTNPLVLTENARDDFIHLQHYIMIGNFQRDPDRFEYVEQWARWFVGWVDRAGPEALDLAVAREKQKRLADELEGLRQSQAAGRKSGLGRLFGGSAAARAPAAGLSPEQISERIAALMEQIFEAEEEVRVRSAEYDTVLGEMISAPENAEEMFGVARTEQQIAELRRRGAPREEIAALDEKADVQRYLLDEFYKSAEQAKLLPFIGATYEVARIYPEFCPPLNPQNLKLALLQPEDRQKAVDLITHYRLPEDRLAILQDAAGRVKALGARDLRAMLARYIADYFRYRRDARHHAVFQALSERVNLALDEKTQRLSHINGTLYEFLLPEEGQRVSERVTGHVILKADVRDSSRLTSELMARGLNPASYFSLNFYEPLNRILPRYGAEKVFIEGDAIILAIFEKEGGAGQAVALACGLAREMIEIVRLYNSKSEGSGLPQLEIGIGICWKNTAPLYLLDGETRIMISEALNLSDRLSGCSKLARKALPEGQSPFNVYVFQTISEEAAGGAMEEFLVRYNVNGISLDEEAFEKLREEISFSLVETELPVLWGEKKVHLYCGSVPVSQDVYQRLVVRRARVPFVDAQSFSLREYTRRRYSEVCTDKRVYDYVENLPAGSVAHGS